jgi:hypothetical protein
MTRKSSMTPKIKKNSVRKKRVEEKKKGRENITNRKRMEMKNEMNFFLLKHSTSEIHV